MVIDVQSVQVPLLTTQSLGFGCAISLSPAYLFPSKLLCAGAGHCTVQPRLWPPAGGDHETGAIYLGALSGAVTFSLEPEGEKHHEAMCVNKKYAFSKFQILQAVPP